jgi:hypothetical protein
MSDEVTAVQSDALTALPATGSGGPGNWEIPKNLTAMSLLNETKAFVVVRALVCAVVAGILLAANLLVWGLFILFFVLVAKNSGSAIPTYIALIVVACGVGAMIGFLKFVRDTVLYFIKAAHVAAITEYLKTGKTPVTEKGYKGVLAFGKEKVSKHLGATAIAFVMDKLVARATRQIMRLVNKVMNLFSFIPGIQNVQKFVEMVLSTALNFVDEAVLSYIFYHTEEKNSWKKACDGLVFYTQAWKGMLMGALKVSAFIWVLRVVCFAALYGIVAVIIGLIPGIGAIGAIAAIIFAVILTYGVQTALVEPYATCMMIKDYHIAISDKTLKVDVYKFGHDALAKASGAFRDLFDRAKKEPAGLPDAPAPEPVAVPVAVASESAGVS